MCSDAHSITLRKTQFQTFHNIKNIEIHNNKGPNSYKLQEARGEFNINNYHTANHTDIKEHSSTQITSGTRIYVYCVLNRLYLVSNSIVSTPKLVLRF